MIDTLAISERLAKEGFTEEQARALAEQFFATSSDTDIVTKKDLALLEASLTRTLVTWSMIIVGMILGAYALIIGLYVQIVGHLWKP